MLPVVSEATDVVFDCQFESDVVTVPVPVSVPVPASVPVLAGGVHVLAPVPAPVSVSVSVPAGDTGTVFCESGAYALLGEYVDIESGAPFPSAGTAGV